MSQEPSRGDLGAFPTPCRRNRKTRGCSASVAHPAELDAASDSRDSLGDVNRLSQRGDLFLMGKARQALASSSHTDADANILILA